MVRFCTKGPKNLQVWSGFTIRFFEHKLSLSCAQAVLFSVFQKKTLENRAFLGKSRFSEFQNQIFWHKFLPFSLILKKTHNAKVQIYQILKLNIMKCNDDVYGWVFCQRISKTMRVWSFSIKLQSLVLIVNPRTIKSLPLPKKKSQIFLLVIFACWEIFSKGFYAEGSMKSVLFWCSKTKHFNLKSSILAARFSLCLKTIWLYSKNPIEEIVVFRFVFNLL